MKRLQTPGAAILVALMLTVTGCSGPSADAGNAAPAVTAEAPYVAHGSVRQAYVTGADPGQELLLVSAHGRVVARGTTDRFGSLVFRDVEPGAGYTVRSKTADGVEGSDPIRVTVPSEHPDPNFYADQEIGPGLNYIEMRDGVTLAVALRLPLGKTIDDGPFPTVIEYSGYQTAAPKDLLTAMLNGKTDDPLVPSTSTAVGAAIAPLLGFATVSVQMRGSGCSGGAFGLFDEVTTTDGYDAVETVAAQDWVKGHKVGMVGISFSGISQMFVGGTRPPHLAALAPLSITDDLYSTGYPGGIFNNGFAKSWVLERANDAQPAPEGGQPYAKALVTQGDAQCTENQKLRLQTPDVEELIASNDHRDPALFEARSPAKWAAEIDVPTFLVGALQDEQTGPQWTNIIPALDDNPDVWITMINGAHIDSLGPAILSQWGEFLKLFVADELPAIPDFVAQNAPLLFNQIADAPAMNLPPVRFGDEPSVEAARKAFARDTPRIRVLFDNGGGDLGPGALQPTGEAGFSTWPPSGDDGTTFYLGADGTLQRNAPTASTSVTFTPDPAARPAVSVHKGADVWSAQPDYGWTPLVDGTAVGFVSAPLATDTVVVGPASLDLSIGSSAPDTDLQVTLSEVLPGGGERYLTSGWLRASMRELDTALSTPLHPVHTFAKRGISPLPAGKATTVRVALGPLGHIFRAGSKIRVTVEAPGGDRPVWRFDTPATNGSVTDTIHLGGASTSRLVLPVVDGVTVDSPAPACDALRGEPCRTYVPASNGG